MRSEYTVIRAESVADLVTDVNQYCQEGWQPHGGLVVVKDHITSNGIAPVFYQPMTRQKTEDHAAETIHPEYERITRNMARAFAELSGI